MPLSPEDPAVAKLKELKEQGATEEELIAAAETYEVTVSYLLKGFSPDQVRVLMEELLNHMIEVHFDERLILTTGVTVNPEPVDWLSGTTFDGPLN